MGENFTAKQRGIVARKLGYDGRMQGFNNFINNSLLTSFFIFSVTCVDNSTTEIEPRMSSALMMMR